MKGGQIQTPANMRNKPKTYVKHSPWSLRKSYPGTAAIVASPSYLHSLLLWFSHRPLWRTEITRELSNVILEFSRPLPTCPGRLFLILISTMYFVWLQLVAKLGLLTTLSALYHSDNCLYTPDTLEHRPGQASLWCVCCALLDRRFWTVTPLHLTVLVTK